MICPKCGNEYSMKVWRVHKERCTGGESVQEEKEERRQEVAVDEMGRDELLDLADQMGIEVDRRWGVKRLLEAISNG